MKSKVTIRLAVYLVLASFVASVFMGCRTVRQDLELIHSSGDRLQANPSDRQSLSQLEDYLNHPKALIRAQAVSAIGSVGRKHSEALGDTVVPLLIAMLKDDDGAVRREAVLALGQYGRKAVRGVPELVEVLRNYKHADAAWFAAEVLGNLGTPAQSAVPELIRSLDARGTSGGIHEFTMAQSAAIALFNLSPLAIEHVSELLKRLNSLSGDSLSFVALAILKSQPRNTSACEALTRVLTGESHDPAAVALQEIDKLPIMLFDLRILSTALAQSSESSNREVRELSSKQLARFKDHGVAK